MNRIFVIVCLFLAAGASGCGEDIQPGRTAAETQHIEGLSLQEAQLESLSKGESYVGTVESRDRGVIAARTDGRVERKPVREGETVEAGELLLVLADNQSADRLKEARGAAAEAQSGLAAARAQLELAQSTHRRYAQLMANEAITPQEMDGVEARLEKARQQVKRAEAARSRTLAGVAAARTAASWTRVKAPYAGRIIRSDVEVGSTVMPGAPLLILDRLGDWQVRAAVPASRFDRIVVGQRLQVDLPSRGLSLSGVVLEILPTADPQSRSFEIKLALEDDPALAAGLFARVHAPAPEAQVLLVPASAVVERGQLHGLYVVEDGRLHFRLVRLGRHIEESVEVLSGLNPGETIVVDGVNRARDGARVEGG